MTTSTPGGELAIRLNHYETETVREQALNDLGDTIAQHPFRLHAGWSPAGPDANVDMDLVGAVASEDVRDMARALLNAATELFTRADDLDARIVNTRFEAIVSGPTARPGAPGEGDEESGPQGVYPGWANMPPLDQALAIEHIQALRKRHENDPAPVLTYIADEQLRTLSADYAHKHAMHLHGTLGIPETLERDVLETLQTLLRQHRKGND